MLVFTNEQIKKFFIGAVIFTILYMLIYHKKGQTKNFEGYIRAIRTLLYIFNTRCVFNTRIEFCTTFSNTKEI